MRNTNAIHDAQRADDVLLSVIIPVLNDAEALRDCLAHLGAGDLAVQVIVVDGGSGDASTDVARAAGATVLTSPVRLRAAQMNLGAASALGGILLFLHADTLLPAGWPDGVRRAFAETPDLVGGAFRRRFVPGSPFLRLTCGLADLRCKLSGWFLGDQVIVVRRSVFRELDGFRPFGTCEDLDFSRRMARRGPVCLFRETVLSSDRRFANRGALRQTLVDMLTVFRLLRHPEAFLLRGTVVKHGPPETASNVAHGNRSQA